MLTQLQEFISKAKLHRGADTSDLEMHTCNLWHKSKFVPVNIKPGDGCSTTCGDDSETELSFTT